MTGNQNQNLQWLLVPFINCADTFDTMEGLKLGKETVSHLLAAAPGVKYNPLTPYVRPTGYASTPIKDQDIFFSPPSPV